MTADHRQYFEAGAKEVRGMYRHRIHRARGYAAHRGWARLLLDRRRGIIHHGGRTTHLPDRHQDAEQGGQAKCQYQYPERREFVWLQCWFGTNANAHFSVVRALCLYILT